MATLILIINVVLAIGLAVYFTKNGVKRREPSVLGGVCQGVAPILNLSPRLVRVIAAILLFTPLAGTAFLLYIVLWLALEHE